MSVTGPSWPSCFYFVTSLFAILFSSFHRLRMTLNNVERDVKHPFIIIIKTANPISDKTFLQDPRNRLTFSILSFLTFHTNFPSLNLNLSIVANRDVENQKRMANTVDPDDIAPTSHLIRINIGSTAVYFHGWQLPQNCLDFLRKMSLL